MRKPKQARKVGNREPLSLRFLPQTKRRLDVLAKKEKASFSSFASSVCSRYLDGRLRLMGRPPRLPKHARRGTSVSLDPAVELRLARVADKQEWALSYLVRRILEWFAGGWLIDAGSHSKVPTAG